MSDKHSGVLDKMEKSGYDVFTQRAYTGTREELMRIAKTFLRDRYK